MTVQFTVDDDALARADHALRARFPAVPRALALTLLKSGRIRVDGAPARLGTKLRRGATVTVDIARERLGEASTKAPEVRSSAKAARAATSVTAPFTLLHRTPTDGFASLVIVDKAEGVAMHEGTGVVDSEDDDADVAAARPLTGLIRDAFGAVPSFLGRLDRPTSGLVVCALDEATLKAVLPAWQAGDVRKEYLALVHGGQGLDDEDIVDVPLVGRRPRQRGTGVVEEAKTGYRVLARGGGRALLLCELFSGRTHQIRRHMKAIRHPIVGDPRYGARHDDGEGGLMLHAWRLRRSGLAQTWPTELPERITAPCPARLRRACQDTGIDVDTALARAD